MIGWVCTDTKTLVPPQTEPIETSMALDYLRASSSEQSLLNMFIAACRVDLERRLGRALAQQTLLSTFQLLTPERAIVTTVEGRLIDLYLPPVQSVSLVEVTLDADTWQAMTAGSWHVEGNQVLVDDLTFIEPLDEVLHMRITYITGATTIDAADKMMLLQYVAHRYYNREDDSIPEDLSEALRRTKTWLL